MAPILNTKGLSKIYQLSRTVSVPALNDINFQVQKGEMIAILGKSGSGKSTLLNLLAGLDRPTSGSIVCDGKDLALMNQRQLVNHRRETIGMVFQSFNLVQWMSALDNVALSVMYHGLSKGEARQRAEHALAGVGLAGRIQHKPMEMSGGEQQRVAIARAMVNQPPILLADEPSGNLDSVTSEQIMDVIREKNKEMGLTVLVITHDEDIARKYCQRHIRMADGEIAKELIFTDDGQEGGQ